MLVERRRASMASRRSQLRYLVTVAEEGQITRAAMKLGLAQPTLSQAIAQLERELGAELLERRPRGVALTPAGEAFIAKARTALEAEADAAQTARSLARSGRGALAVGFVGPPPVTSTPELFAVFAASHPDAQLAFRDLPFPSGRTSTWLADVDVAICHPPARDPGIGFHAIRVEPRALVAHRDHPLALRDELDVHDALDETFVGYDPEVQRAWAGFHCLDDHRGAPPANTTDDHALTTLQMLGIMSSSRQAITAVPYRDATIAQQILPDVMAIPLADLEPAMVSLVWHTDNPNPLLGELLTAAGHCPSSGDGV
jgi:DNA-binding transcriptional LysR family regulator